MRKERSPAYPSMNLQEALTKLGTFHANTKGYPVEATDEKPVAFKELGFEKPHGNAKRALAALIAFGLVENVPGETPRKVKTSDLGKKLATYPQDHPQRPEWIRESAIRPKIYSQIISKFPDGLPPSDSPLTSFLLEQGYNPSVTGELIKDFKATAEFANLFGRAAIPEEREDEREVNVEATRPAAQKRLEDEFPRESTVNASYAPAVPPGMRAVPILLGLGREVILQVPADFSKQDIEDFDESWDIYKRRILRDLAKQALAPNPNSPMPPPEFRKGPALWRSKDSDLPVEVITYAGKHQGRHYVGVAGSNAGVPLDELVYDED